LNGMRGAGRTGITIDESARLAVGRTEISQSALVEHRPGRFTADRESPGLLCRLPDPAGLPAVLHDLDADDRQA
jgi:hypothetical protein